MILREPKCLKGVLEHIIAITNKDMFSETKANSRNKETKPKVCVIQKIQAYKEVTNSPTKTVAKPSAT